MFLSCHVRNSEWIQVSTNGWVFVYELSGSGFESSCSQLDFYYVWLKILVNMYGLFL